MATDYKPIKIAYIFGKCNNEGKHAYPTLAELAQEHGLSLSTLTHKAAEEGWTRQRQKSEDRIIQEAFRQYESEMAALLGQMDKQAARASALMLDTIVEALENAETSHERQALTARFSKMMPDILNAGHSAIGVERVLERIENVRDLLG